MTSFGRTEVAGAGDSQRGGVSGSVRAAGVAPPGRGRDEVEERDVFLEFDKKLGLRLIEAIPPLEGCQQRFVLGRTDRQFQCVDRAVTDHAVAVLDLNPVFARQPDQPAVTVLEVEARAIAGGSGFSSCVEAQRRVTAARVARVGLDVEELDPPAGCKSGSAGIAGVGTGRTREDCEYGRQSG